jgi:2-polyprenyl-3-methyl-5-hydroxy-6-metoxy-1,4-benzoquinol methylase
MFTPLELISPAYLKQQRVLHAAPRGYGGRGSKWAGVVLQVALEYQASSILDYGCGQGSLAATLRAQPWNGIRISEYDPAIRGKDMMPEFADLVVCTDVLEHIEPDRLGNVLAHLKLLARKAVFAVISLKTSNKTLKDGRNAHLIVQPGAWWKDRLRKAGFTLHNPPTVVREGVGKEWVVVLTS